MKRSQGTNVEKAVKSETERVLAIVRRHALSHLKRGHMESDNNYPMRASMHREVAGTLAEIDNEIEARRSPKRREAR